jgi:hypothetical protein
MGGGAIASTAIEHTNQDRKPAAGASPLGARRAGFGCRFAASAASADHRKD